MSASRSTPESSLEPTTQNGTLDVVEKREEEEGATETPPGPVVTKFPEGGLRAWMVVLGSSITLGCAFGYISAFGVYETYYGRHQLADKTPSQIAWIGSTQVFFQYGTSIISGPLFDLHGARVVMIPGTISYVFSIMMTSLCKEYYQFILAQGILGGLSTGFLFTPGLASIGHYFQKRRGFAMGVGASAASLGGLILPIVLKHAVSSETLGFEWGVRVIGFAILALLAIACPLVRGRLPPRRGRLFIPRAFCQPSYSFLVAAIFLSMWSIWVPYFFIVSYALDVAHMGPHLSFYCVSLINAGSLFGRIIPGFFADKVGKLNMLVCIYASNCVILFSWIAVHSSAGLIVWATVFGFSSGAIISLYPASVAHITPRPQEIGTWLGQCTGLISIAGLTGTPIAGALIHKYGYWAAAVFAAAAMCVCTILAAIARACYNPKLRVKV